MVSNILKSSLFKASGVYTISSIINAGIPFILLPIFTRYLTPEEYGIVAMFGILLSVIGVFTGLSVHGAINRVYLDGNNFDFKEYVYNCLLILLISSLLVFLIVCFLKDFISGITGVPPFWVCYAVVVSFFQFIFFSAMSIYQAQMKAKIYAFIQISQSLLNALLSVGLIVLLKMGWEGRLTGQTVPIIIFGYILLIILFRRWIKPIANINYIKHALNFGIPLIPHAIGGMLILATDRFMINNMLGLKETGLYTAGMQIGMILGILTDSFNKAWAPWLISKLNKNEFKIKVKIVIFTYAYFFCILIAALLLGIFAPFIVKIMFGKDFYSAKDVIIWVSLGYAFNGMYYIVVNYIFYVYKTHLLAGITFFSGIINVPITYFLIKLNGLIGAAQAVTVTYFLTFILTWYISIKVYKMPWKEALGVNRWL